MSDADAIEFAYSMRDPALGSASLAPMLPVTLGATNSVSAVGLLDSGATVNVMPFTLGQQLGFRWEEQTRVVALSGNLARVEARVVTVAAQVGDFSAVRLAFAWTETDASPLILGQVNFFMEFDVCFFRARESFEVRPKSAT